MAKGNNHIRQDKTAIISLIIMYFYALIGKPVIGSYGKWYKYIRPRRLTLKRNQSIYKWLWWNFTWDARVK